MTTAPEVPMDLLFTREGTIDQNDHEVRLADVDHVRLDVLERCPTGERRYFVYVTRDRAAADPGRGAELLIGKRRFDDPAEAFLFATELLGAVECAHTCTVVEDVA